MKLALGLALSLALPFGTGNTVPAAPAGPAPARQEAPRPAGETTVASWYGPGFHGRLTASGRVYDQRGLTAAHRTLPMGTRVRVTNLRNGRSLVLTVDDRGPYVEGRGLDCSLSAAEALGFVREGLAPVLVEPLGAGE